MGVGDALIILSPNELWDLLEVLISPDLYHSCRMLTEMNYSVRLEPALSFSREGVTYFVPRNLYFCYATMCGPKRPDKSDRRFGRVVGHCKVWSASPMFITRADKYNVRL